MTDFEKFHTSIDDSATQPLATQPHAAQSLASGGLPAEAAQNYVHEMLVELLHIAEGAQLKDLAGLLRVTIEAVSINSRFL